ncbi:MAG: phosphoribulokinase [Candidatus Eremiobacteraeota bacterium]|nr:phosphoribulokinase [Candidatus Eremiobacteraeota bacterium]
MIAIGGDSGSGKITLSRGFGLIFGNERTATVSLDDYHSLDRAQRRAVDITAADPRANNFAAMEEDLWALREGRAMSSPTYDHATGKFVEPHVVEPKDIVVVYGLFPLYTRSLRSLFDVTVWLDPEPGVKTAWKLQRDTSQRGYNESEVRAAIERRKPDVEKYVAPQAKYADLTVTFFGEDGWHDDGDPAKLSARIRKGGRFQPLDYEEFRSASTSMRQTRTVGGRYPETLIELSGNFAPDAAEAVIDRLWAHVGEDGRTRPAGLGAIENASGNSSVGYTLALAQLLIARRVVLIEHELLEAVT